MSWTAISSRCRLLALAATGVLLWSDAICTLAIAQVQLLPAGSAQMARILTIQDPFGDSEFSEVQLVDSADDAAAAISEQTAVEGEEVDSEAAKAEARKKARLDQIKKTKFDRRPSTILNLWAGQGKPKPAKEVEDSPAVNSDDQDAETAEQPEPTEEEIEKAAFAALLVELSNAVTLGKWEQVGEFLKDENSFNKEESLLIYRQILQQLSSDVGMDFSRVVGLSDEMQSFMQSMMNNRRNNPAQQFAEKHTVNFADIIAMIQVAPQELEDKDIQTLAGLLQRTLGEGSQLEDFVSSLKAGGTELMSPDQAALLLSSAGCDEFTPDFLSPIEQATEAKNAKVLNLWAQHFLAMFAKETKESFREQAWDVTLDVLALKEIDEQQRSEALTRAVSLAPKLRDDLGQAWLQESFTIYPERGKEILAAIGTATAQRLAQTPQDGQQRLRNLQLQHAAVQALMETDPTIDQQWIAILNLLASNWLQEANVSYQYSQANRYGPGMRRDQYGNIYYVDPSEESADGAPMLRMGQITPVEPSDVLATAPEGVWFDSIQSSIQPQYTMTLCRLWLKLNEDAKAFPFIESLSVTHPETARELAEEFLRVWTKNHNPNQESQRTNYYMFMYGYETKADKIPLTRSKQERNLKELSEWVLRLRELPISEQIDENLLVRAFMTCHSVAEVYDTNDIEKIFGNWDGIDAGTMAALIQAMRGNLAGLWRDPNVQRDSGTKRKKADIEAEVKRGYSVARTVLDRSLQTYPGNWQLLLAKACLMHDENDFIQDVSPSSEFSERRAAAFQVFSAAADSYVEKAAELAEREQTNDAFDYWFYAALGATDLAGISEKNQLAPAEIDRILTCMNRLQGEVGKRHQDRFANSLFNRMSAVSPSCKVRYLEAGFKLVGDNPLADEAKQVHDYYKDLVTELELVVRLDGDSRVGSDEPFGCFVDLRHTKELERESGGFAKYLQNQTNAYYSYNYGRPTENYRDKFQDAAIAALQEQFDVLSVTFNHADVKSRATGNDGWRVTPYAYLLLKARGPEVDKIPALRLDLDFLDTSGYVVLPVSSAPLAIDAAEEKANAAASDFKVVQVLDERQSQDGKLIVETKVTAKGLVPSLKTLFDTKQEGFELTDVEDSGVSVVEFDKEAVEPIILSERTFTLKYSPSDPGGITPTRFAFASPVVDVSEINFQRYVDADLEEVEAVVALVEEYGSPMRAWIIGGLCTLAGLTILIGAVVMLRRGAASRVIETPQAQIELTPFSLLSRLKATYADDSIPADRRNRLREDIVQVEQHYFAEANGNAKPDLLEIARRWT